MSDQAVRIFEALSDVDEELLERCNRTENREKTIIYNLFRRYGKAMAACICLIVVGAAAWNGYRLVTGSCGAAGSSAADQTPAEFNMSSSMAVADGGTVGGNSETGQMEKAPGVETSPAGGMSGDGESLAGSAAEDCVRTESDSLPAAAVTALPEDAKQQAVQEHQNQTDDPALSGNGADAGCNTGGKDNMAEKMSELLRKENELSDSRQMISWEEACALKPFDHYLPTVLPFGYTAFTARRSADPDVWNNVIFKWSDGEHILHLSMTLGEVMTREDIERRDGLNEYLAEEFRKDLIPEPAPVDDPISFTLYYADGMRIDFGGCITADEMWAVVESVSK